TDRLASMFINPDRAYDGQNRPQDTGPNYDPREPNDLERRRMMQAVAFKMAFLGSPMIYYGSEAGMWSPDDPSNRMPMVWSDLEPYEGEGVRFREDVFKAYRHLIAMRHTLPALQIGGFEVLITDDERGIFVFARRYGEHHAIVAINRSNETHNLNVPVGDQAVGDAADPNQTVLIEPEDLTGRASLAWDQSFAPLEPDAERFVTLRLSPFDTSVLTPVSALDVDH
ncbi:MAG: alpha-glucosidase C-terminal domain-containing protein, partial [Planctomycetota bacterium]